MTLTHRFRDHVVGRARLWRALAGCAAFFAVLSASAQTGPSPEAIEKARKANEQCFSCHAEEALRNPPRPDLDLKKLREVVRDRDTFHNSDHGRLACAKCHSEGYEDFPHASDAKDMTSTCSDCHSRKADKIDAEFQKSVHAKNLSEVFTCTTCHDPHLMRVAARLSDPGKIVAQDNRVCLGCHDSDQTFAKFAPEKKSRPLIDEIHSWLPNTRLHWQSVRCVECHTPVSQDMLSHEILNKERAERKCVSCHTVDSALKVRLYRHLATQEQNQYGFMNSIMIGKSYIVGATRNQVLDDVLLALAGLTVLGVAGHGLLRFIASRLRRRNRDE